MAGRIRGRSELQRRLFCEVTVLEPRWAIAGIQVHDDLGEESNRQTDTH